MDLFYRKDRVHEVKSNAKIVVNYFENPKWQLVTLMEQLSGFWPYQRKVKQIPLQLFHLFMELSISLGVINKLREFMSTNDTDMVLENCIMLLVFLSLLIKITLASIYQRSRVQIFERIAEHFETITDPEEAAVLNDFAVQGFMYTVRYMSALGICCAVFDSVPILRSFYNYFFLHDKLVIQLPIQFDYGFDHKKYWYIVVLHFLTWVFSGILVNIAYDLAFILQIWHVKALFKIVGLRLNKASELVTEFEDEYMSDDIADQSYATIVSAIDLHSKCLEIIELIEKTYTINWFIVLLMNTSIFGAAAYLIDMRWHDSIDTFRNLFAFALVLIHFYVIFAQGQQIINSSSLIPYICYDCKWYSLPKKSCRLVNMMMIRTSVPCTITGANIFPLSMESFGKMLKAGLSYYTVFKD